MGRVMTMAPVQLGPVRFRAARIAARRGGRTHACPHGAGGAVRASLVVFPELALTSFLPRWDIDDDALLDGFFETSMPSQKNQPLFNVASRLRMALCLSFGELAHKGGRRRRFNSSALIGPDGGLIDDYRKLQLPGDREP